MIKIYAMKTIEDLPEDVEIDEYMTAERKAKALRSRRKEAKSLMITTGLLEAYVLTRELQVGIRELELSRNTYGRPYVKGMEKSYAYNISHAGDWVVMVIGEENAGIDLEQESRYSERITRRFFLPEEQAILSACKEEERPGVFARQWTMKESFVKYFGLGFTVPITGVLTKDEGEYGVVDPVGRMPEVVEACFRQVMETEGRMPICKIIPFQAGYCLSLCADEAVLRVAIPVQEIGLWDILGS